MSLHALRSKYWRTPLLALRHKQDKRASKAFYAYRPLSRPTLNSVELQVAVEKRELQSTRTTRLCTLTENGQSLSTRRPESVPSSRLFSMCCIY